MNNKGFAIMTVLYGLLILFCLLLVSLLGMLSVLKNNLNLLMEEDNGARKSTTLTASELPVTKRGLYCTMVDNEEIDDEDLGDNPESDDELYCRYFSLGN